MGNPQKKKMKSAYHQKKILEKHFKKKEKWLAYLQIEAISDRREILGEGGRRRDDGERVGGNGGLYREWNGERKRLLGRRRKEG